MTARLRPSRKMVDESIEQVRLFLRRWPKTTHAADTITALYWMTGPASERHEASAVLSTKELGMLMSEFVRTRGELDESRRTLVALHAALHEPQVIGDRVTNARRIIDQWRLSQ